MQIKIDQRGLDLVQAMNTAMARFSECESRPATNDELDTKRRAMVTAIKAVAAYLDESHAHTPVVRIFTLQLSEAVDWSPSDLAVQISTMYRPWKHSR